MAFLDIKKLSVLIVEDEPQILEQMKIALEDFTDVLFAAKNGEVALKILEEEKIDILITDILMPLVGGVELIREIRKKHTQPGTIIITTAYSETAYLLEAIKLRVDGYLLKPIVVKDMIELIQKSILVKQKDEELKLRDKLLCAINTFVGGKKIEIIKHLYTKADEDGVYRGSYEDIMAELNISKPTVVSTFKQLIEVGLVRKIKNTVYQIKMG